MATFLAIVLVCAKSVAIEACDEVNAIDVLQTPVSNEMRCTMGWQEVIARSSMREGIGSETYLKTLCRRAARETGPGR